MAKLYKQKMIEEMQIRGLSDKTLSGYYTSMRKFMDFIKKPPAKVDIDDIKKYQKNLIEMDYAAHTVNKELAAIRFFYRHVLGRHWYSKTLPEVKVVKKIPPVLTEDEVKSMINAVDSLLHKAVLMVTYSAGLRNAEVRNLKITDVDSKNMVLNIRKGKGGYPRQALLSSVTLQVLRRYWFAHRVNCDAELKKKLSHTALGYIVKNAARLAGIKKKFIPTFFVTRLQLIF